MHVVGIVVPTALLARMEAQILRVDIAEILDLRGGSTGALLTTLTSGATLTKMMRWMFGIYGFQFNWPANFGQLEIKPLPNRQERGKSKDLLLTGFGLLPMGVSENELDDLITTTMWFADAMTFCQQSWVAVSKLFQVSEGESGAESLPDEIPIHFDRSSGGSIIIEDSRNRNSRRRFFDLFAQQMKTDPDGPLARAIYRQLEISRLARPFWELQHFMAFSGLEILARTFASSERKNKNVAVPMTALLNDHGFRISKGQDSNGRQLWGPVSQTLMEEFAAARNAAFHRGEEHTIAPGSQNSVSAIDQLFSLKMALADVCLRLLKFDDGRINWDRWGDRVAFGQRAVSQ